MKIGLISFHSFYQPGGVKRHILGLFKEFKRRGIETKIIAPRRKRNEDYGKDVILLGTSFPLPFSGGVSDLGINFNPLAIETTLRREKFDVLHFHNVGFPSTLQILTSPYASKTLNVLTFHANVKGSEIIKNFPFLLSIVKKIVDWKIDGVIGVAPLNLEPFKKYKKPKVVIPNGIDLEIFNPNVPKIEKFLDGKINILFLSRIEKRKGLIYFLKAYKVLQKKFQNLRLIVCGEGPLKEKMEKWVEKNKLKEVIFEGEIKEEEVVRYYNSCDVFCAPAIFGESFGLILVEAMACQKPVVAFANEGYFQFLKDKKGGILVKNRDWKELAKKLEILIKDEKLRKKMGKIAQKEAQNYSWEKIADRVLNFYQLCQREKERKVKASLF